MAVKGYITLCAYSVRAGYPEVEFMEYFDSREDAIDRLASSIGVEYGNDDHMGRDEEAIGRHLSEIELSGETRKDEMLWVLTEVLSD